MRPLHVVDERFRDGAIGREPQAILVATESPPAQRVEEVTDPASQPLFTAEEARLCAPTGNCAANMPT